MAMAISTTYTYDNASNFSFNATKIEITGGQACLALEQAIVPRTLSIDDDTGSTYDSTKAEFTGGLVQQLSFQPSNSVIIATYTSSLNANYNDVGSTIATQVGGPAILSNRLDCTTNDGVTYPISDIIRQGAIKFKYTPNYSGSPPTNVNLVSLVGASNSNRLLLTHSPSGDNFRIFLTHSTGTVIYSAVTIGASSLGLVSGTTYEMELNWDATAGTIRLFRNGVSAGTLTPGAWTWATQTATIGLGASASTYNASAAFFEDMVLYSAVQHTAGYTPGYTLQETKYLETDVILPTIEQSVVGTLQAVTDFSTTETGSPRYLVQIGASSDWLYWNGSAWVASDETYAQSSSAATVTANVGDLNVTGEEEGKIRIVFPASNTNSSVDEIVVTFNTDIGYYTDDPAILTNSAFQTDGLISFTETADKPTNTEIKYTLVISGQDYYWDGNSWTTSDGTYAQANTAAEINTNADSFSTILGNGTSVKVNAILRTTNSQVRPCLTSVAVEYSFYTTATAIETTTVYGYIYNGTAAVEDATITFKSSRVMLDNNNFIHINKSTTSRSNGYFEIELPKTSDDANTVVAVKIKFTDEQGITRTREFNIDVTAAASSEEIEGLIV